MYFSSSYNKYIYSTLQFNAVPAKNLLEEHDSYHESITCEQAERRLRKYRKPCSYLTHYSEVHQSYILTVYKRQSPFNITKHFKIVITDNGKRKIEGKDEAFDKLDMMLISYEKNRIDPALKSIGQKYTKNEYDRKWRIFR